MELAKLLLEIFNALPSLDNDLVTALEKELEAPASLPKTEVAATATLFLWVQTSSEVWLKYFWSHFSFQKISFAVGYLYPRLPRPQKDRLVDIAEKAVQNRLSFFSRNQENYTDTYYIHHFSATLEQAWPFALRTSLEEKINALWLDCQKNPRAESRLFYALFFLCKTRKENYFFYDVFYQLIDNKKLHSKTLTAQQFFLKDSPKQFLKRF